jgi:hypothetical protein
MDNQYITSGEDMNTEFDQWLSSQLKDTQVEPPKNFNQMVFRKLSEAESKGVGDPTILIVLLVVIVSGTVLLTISSLPSNYMYGISHYFSALNFQIDFSSTTRMVLGITVVGLILFGLDNVLGKKVSGRRNMSLG